MPSSFVVCFHSSAGSSPVIEVKGGIIRGSFFVLFPPGPLARVMVKRQTTTFPMPPCPLPLSNSPNIAFFQRAISPGNRILAGQLMYLQFRLQMVLFIGPSFVPRLTIPVTLASSVVEVVLPHVSFSWGHRKTFPSSCLTVPPERKSLASRKRFYDFPMTASVFPAAVNTLLLSF